MAYAPEGVSTPRNRRVTSLAVTLLVPLIFLPQLAWGDSVVGTGTAGSCTEAALNAALAVGGSITFNCGGPATITVTSTKTISAGTTIDGGSLTTISGGNSVSVFRADGNSTVQNLTIAKSIGATGIVSGAMPAAGGGTAAKLSAEAQAQADAAESDAAWKSADSLGYDELIDPRELRNALLAALELSAGRNAEPPTPARHTGVRP
jgi:hypothetical protein